MTILNRLARRPTLEHRNADRVIEAFLRSAGINIKGARTVTADRAMRHGAVFACVDLIAELTATLPVTVHRGTGTARVTVDPPRIITEPSLDLDGIGWRRAVLTSWLLRGNAYGIVTEIGPDHRPARIELLDPDTVAYTRDRGFTVAGQPHDRWPLGDLWHRPALEYPGTPLGLSPIGLAATAVNLGLAAEGFGADFFDDGAHPTSVLETDHEVTAEQAAAIKARFLAAVNGRREPAVLGLGVTWRPISVAPDESQFLDTIRANRTTIAGFYRIPAELIGGEAGGSMTYANVEQRFLSLLVTTIGPWLTRLENALNALTPRGQYVKANTGALLRTDVLTRYNAHALAVRTGWRSVNEVREIEDEPPIDTGDLYLWPPMTTSAPAPPPDGAPTEEP